MIFFAAYAEPFKAPGGGRNLQNCTHESPALPGKVCRVPIEKFAPCDIKHYQYDRGSPCIFLKLNRVSGFIDRSKLLH